MPMSLGESGRGTSGRKGRTPATPWRRILGHPAVWAILVNNFTFHYAFYVVMNWLPTYFDKVGSHCESVSKLSEACNAPSYMILDCLFASCCATDVRLVLVLKKGNNDDP